jgi:competence protein ComEA
MNMTRIVLIGIAIVTAVAGAYAVFQVLDERSAPPIFIEDAAAIRPVVVDVRGAVETPGVYELPPGARTQDAIAAAGGLSEVADLSTVNLARRLRDGEVVTFFELPVPGNTPVTSDNVSPAGSEASVPRINLNTATAEELDVLPGVGEVTAARIISYREQYGPFRSVDDLIHVEGISERTIDTFRDQVTIGP